MLGINAFRGTPVVAPSGARRYTDEAHAIAARDVEFDWDGV
ncbi:metal-dependent hydrolase, partial [Rhodococcus erythropolis]